MGKKRIAVEEGAKTTQRIIEELKAIVARVSDGTLTSADAKKLIEQIGKDRALLTPLRAREVTQVGGETIRAVNRAREDFARQQAEKVEAKAVSARRASGLSRIADRLGVDVRAGLSGLDVRETFGFGRTPALAGVSSALETAQRAILDEKGGTGGRSVVSVANTAPEIRRSLIDTGRRAASGSRLTSLGAKGAIGAGLLTILGPRIAEIFGGGKDNIDPQVQLQLAQQLAGGGGGDGGVNTSRSLRDIAKLLTIMKGLQELSGLGGQAVPQRLI